MIFSRLCQNNDQRSGWFQSPGFQDSRVPGSNIQGSKVQGSKVRPGFQKCEVSKFQGSRGTEVPEVQSFKVPGFQGSRISFQGSRFQDSRVPGFLVQVAFTVPGFQGFQKFQSSRGQGSRSFQSPEVSKFQCSKVRVPRFQGCRGPGFQGSSIPRFQGFRVSGFQGTRVPRFQGSKVSRVSRVPRVPRVPEFQGSRVPGSQQGSRCAGLHGSKVPGFQGCRVPELCLVGDSDAIAVMPQTKGHSSHIIKMRKRSNSRDEGGFMFCSDSAISYRMRIGCG